MMLILLLALAQTAPALTVVLPPDTPFRISFEGQPDADARFRWWCDGAIVKNFAPADLAKGAVTADGLVAYEGEVPGVARGAHSCLVSAWTSASEAMGAPEAKSVAVPIVAGTLPVTPINLRVLVTVTIK